MKNKAPRVTVGMPVHNGEKYIAEALDTLLKQSFSDFALVISDNASTDRTEEICREYCTRDSRVRYARADRNRGAAWNFNAVVEGVRSEYFKWAAYDDLCAPTFLARCVEVLDQCPEVAWCHPLSKPIDGTGAPLSGPAGQVFSYTAAPAESATSTRRPLGGDPTQNTRESARAYRRLRSILLGPGFVHDIYGLIRLSALQQTGLNRPFFGNDKVLLAELSLLGRFVEIPEVLFFPRCHDEQLALLPTSRAIEAEESGNRKRYFIVPRRMRCLWAYFLIVLQARIGWYDRLRCFTTLGHFLVEPRKWKRLGIDMLRRVGFKISVPEDAIREQLTHTCGDYRWGESEMNESHSAKPNSTVLKTH